MLTLGMQVDRCKLCISGIRYLEKNTIYHWKSVRNWRGNCFRLDILSEELVEGNNNENVA